MPGRRGRWRGLGNRRVAGGGRCRCHCPVRYQCRLVRRSRGAVAPALSAPRRPSALERSGWLRSRRARDAARHEVSRSAPVRRHAARAANIRGRGGDEAGNHAVAQGGAGKGVPLRGRHRHAFRDDSRVPRVLRLRHDDARRAAGGGEALVAAIRRPSPRPGSPRSDNAIITRAAGQFMNAAKIIDIRGRKLGGEAPLVCSPLVGRIRERVLAEAATVIAKKPDVVEWRVDYFEGIADTAAVLGTAKALRAALGDTPIVFTRRSVKEGGEPIAIDDEAVVRLYDAVAASRLVDFIDFEMGNDSDHLRRVRDSTRAHEVRLILSYHNFAYTPGIETLVQRFLEAERLGADVAKVAVMPRDRMDVLTLLAATARADAKGSIPLISM